MLAICFKDELWNNCLKSHLEMINTLKALSFTSHDCVKNSETHAQKISRELARDKKSSSGEVVID